MTSLHLLPADDESSVESFLRGKRGKNKRGPHVSRAEASAGRTEALPRASVPGLQRPTRGGLPQPRPARLVRGQAADVPGVRYEQDPSLGPRPTSARARAAGRPAVDPRGEPRPDHHGPAACRGRHGAGRAAPPGLDRRAHQGSGRRGRGAGSDGSLPSRPRGRLHSHGLRRPPAAPCGPRAAGSPTPACAGQRRSRSRMTAGSTATPRPGERATSVRKPPAARTASSRLASGITATSTQARSCSMTEAACPWAR